MAGITSVNEPPPISLAATSRPRSRQWKKQAYPQTTPSAFRVDAATVEEYLRCAENIQWHGHVIANPARLVDADIVATDYGYDLALRLDTM